MALLASEVMDHAAAAFLNDPDKTIYTYTVQLPHLKSAMLMLQGKMLEAGISTLDVKNSTSLTVTAVTQVKIDSTTSPALPSDLIYPIELSERASGSIDQFMPMRQAEQLPKRPQGSFLQDWTWENDGIQLIGALQAIEVQLLYQKVADVITASTTPITVLGSKLYLAAETAALAALIVGKNTERASALETIAQKALDVFEAGHVKEAQGYPARRLPYGFARRQIRRNLLGRGR